MDSIQNIINNNTIEKNIDCIFGIVAKIKKDKLTLTKTASTDIDAIDKYINGEDVKVNVSVSKILEAKKSDLDDEIDLIEENIKIISREIKDPHYDVMISSTKMKNNSDKIYVVSFFLKENYLGRYLISRNLYFLENNVKESKKAFDEIVEFVKTVRNNYYEDEFDSIQIPIMLQNYIIKKEGDFNFERESKLGTTVFSKHVNEATVYEWFQKKKEKSDDRRYANWYDDILEDEDIDDDDNEEDVDVD